MANSSDERDIASLDLISNNSFRGNIHEEHNVGTSRVFLSPNLDPHTLCISIPLQLLRRIVQAQRLIFKFVKIYEMIDKFVNRVWGSGSGLSFLASSHASSTDLDVHESVW